MQDNYVGDIGDYGKYGLLRTITASGLSLAVNWYQVRPLESKTETANNRRIQQDGKYTSYLSSPEQYRHYDPELFDCLFELVKKNRTIEAVEKSGVVTADFFGEILTGKDRNVWHERGLEKTSGAQVVFLDPDNGLETERMHQCGTASEKHVAWQELKDYYERGQSVILYQHRPQRTKKESCIQSVLAFQTSFLQADCVCILDYPRYTNRYYFLFVRNAHRNVLEKVYHSVVQNWAGVCYPIDFCRPAGDR